MKKLFLATATVAMFAAPAFAGPSGHDKNKNAKKADRYEYSDRRLDADCPPGLRDKGCLPPGQAKKYRIGYPLPYEYDRFRDYDRYDLRPPRDGYYYSRVGQDILLVSEATRNVAELVTIIDILTD